MYHLHLTRNLRSLAFLLIVAAVLAGIGTLWWANLTGLPESWRATIEREISKQGAHVKIGALSYLPLRGVVASKVRVFSDPKHQYEISRLERVTLVFDKTLLARGKFHINKVELKDAALSLPVDPHDPESEALDVTDVNGILYMPGNRRFEIRNATGRIAGIDVNLNARLTGYRQEGESQADASQMGKRRELLARIIDELDHWHFDSANPPKMQVFIEGDANDRSSINAKLSLLATGVEKNQHELDTVSCEAEITGDLLTVSSIDARDSRGELNGAIDYDISGREGRFDISSSLEIPRLLKAWAGLPPLRDVLIAGSQTLTAVGEFGIDDEGSLKLRMTGHARCESMMLRGLQFDTVESDFAWRDGEIFLRDARLTRPDGQARGKAMIQWPKVRLSLESNLPAAIYQPLFIDKPLEKVIADFSTRQGAEVNVRLDGGFDATDSKSWAYAGGGNVKNVNFRGVPVNYAECEFSLSAHELDFTTGTVVFNYQKYPLRGAFDGPGEGTAKIGRIRYDAAKKVVEVENVTGRIWAAPLVRLFAVKLADSLETYRFHKPPLLKGSGVVDVKPQGRTVLDVSFESDDPADYVFLGENLTLSAPRGKVSIRGSRVNVADLSLGAFDGPVVGGFEFNGEGQLSGELSWTKLSIPALTSAYDFDLKGGGDVTGRIAFSITNGKVETMSGEGLFALEKTELLSVPMFGPLSPLISGALKDRRAGFERAKDAFCNFRIKEGILTTNDFRTSTTSLTFTGDGSVDLAERTLDMTMRMNAHGLLGLITLPLRPFYGMFQFHGTGPLKKTTWENVMFTTPPKEQMDLLLAAPKAKVVSEP